jgi:uncharacterized iron-regulated protein
MTLALLTFSAAASGPSDTPVIIDVLIGEPVSLEAMLDDLSSARIVYIGEIHSIPRHHRVQTLILSELAKRGLKLCLGMEMFAHSHQPALDKWQAGQESVAHLMRDLGGDAWTNLLDYESLLVMARELKIPIVGLNASDATVRTIARNGPEGLTEQERKDLPEGFDKIDPRHDRLLRLRLKVHRAFQEKSLDRIVLAQSVRDETMASFAVRYLESAEGKDRAMLVVAGSGHLNYGFGIPERVQRRLDVPVRIVLITESGELELTESQKRQAAPVEISHSDLRFIGVPISDYLYATPMKDVPSDPPN